MSEWGPDLGDMLATDEVERRVMAHVQAWTPTCVAAIESKYGLAMRALGTVQSWDRASEFETFDEATPTSVLVVSPGMTGPPVRDGEGKYRATFEVVLGVLVESTTSPEARDLVGRWARAMSLAMTRPGLEGVHGAARWMGEEFDVIPFEATRTMAAARIPFEVEFEDVLETWAGPTEPLEDPYEVPSAGPVVTGYEATVTKE